METSLVTARAALAALLTLVPLGVAAAATPGSPNPDELVNAALRTELDGPSPKREALLRQALSIDPNFAPARWQLGFVRWDDEWLALDEAAKRAAGDKQLTEYRKRRDAMIDTAEAHRELARWCRKNKLAAEERIHWAKALEFDPQDAEALAALGLQLYEGRLLTKEQIAQAKHQAGEKLRAVKHWQPQFVKWRKAFESGRSQDRTEAREAMAKLTDPEALPALEATLAEQGESKKADELNLLLIETVGRMQFPEATQVLLRRAIVPDSVRVRAAAADELKKRPMFAYVPHLIAALPGKIKTKFHVHLLPNGTVLHEHEVFLEGRQADMSLTYESNVSATDILAAMRVTPRALAGELNKAAVIEARATATAHQLEWLRQRVQFVLERTTGLSDADSEELWQKAYNDYQEYYTQPAPKRRYVYPIRETQAYFTPPLTITTEETITRTRASCFPAGTIVHTLYGPRAIEQIAIGDRVLAADVVSGELQYRPIQARTLRPAAPLVKIGLGSASLSATRGHPFWVDGQGWVMAKQLQVGQVLHSLRGAVRIDAIEEAPAQEAYNLVVGYDGTYFAGEDGVMVHDNTPLAETSVLVPGLTVQSASP